MDIVIVVPGIMGSELVSPNGETLWPPSLSDAIHGMEAPERLLDEHVRPGDIVRSHLVYNFYNKLIRPLEAWGYAEHADGPAGKLVVWPYNWTQTIPKLAQALAEKIEELCTNDPQSSVVLLSHSMGGLICTYALECLDGHAHWRKRVRLLVTFGTPFRGSPEIVKNAIGMEGVASIPGDKCKELMGDHRFPSAYQLLPHLSSRSLWMTRPGESHPIDYGALGLDGPNVALAMEFHKRMAGASAAPHPHSARKFNFGSTSHKTVWGMSLTSPTSATALTAISGDGSVPSWSSHQHADVEFAPVGNIHRKTFDDKRVLRTLRTLLQHGPGRPGTAAVDLEAEPVPRPARQPSVQSVAGDVSTLRNWIDVEVLEPPLDNWIQLAWMSIGDVRTPAEVAAMPDPASRTEVVASMPLAASIHYPVLLQIPRPIEPGIYALFAWGGRGERPDALNVEAYDYVMVFQDRAAEGFEPNGGDSPHDRVRLKEPEQEERSDDEAGDLKNAGGEPSGQQMA